MQDKIRRNWTREETILAFDLYCRTPFSKIGSTNKDIISLASLIGRTPGAVGLKMANLASHDEDLKARNIKGMSNGSKLDKEIFDEFSNNWEELSFQAQLIRLRYCGNTSNLDNIVEIETIPEGLEKSTEIRSRVGQYFFRMSILASYNNKCCVTGLAEPIMLIASHIKPWAVSDIKTERTNPRNGLCLNSFHDRAFDQGLITLDNNYRIIISPKINEVSMDEETRKWFFSYNKKEIVLPDKFIPAKEFIEYHNDVIFKT